MKPFLRNHTVLLLLILLITGCIRDELKECNDETNISIITVEPENVWIPYIAQTPAEEKLTVSTFDLNQLPDPSIRWSLSLRDTILVDWLQLTLDSTGLINTGVSVSGIGSQFVYLVALENANATPRTATLSLDVDSTVIVTVTQDVMPIQVSPAEITLNGVPHRPATETVSVISNREWTLTSNHSWLQLSLNETGNNASGSVYSTGNKTVYLVVDGNGEIDVRMAGIYLNNNVNDIRVVVLQNSLVAETGDAAERIFILEDDDDKVLMLTKDPTNYGTFFQFGSVIGWNWNSITANYNPTNNASLINWNINWSNGNKNVVHSHAELILGRGDPCRLAGYKTSDIKNALAAGLAPDNGLWRMPTNEENIVFGSSATAWTSIDDIAGWIVAEAGNPNGIFLPAAGRRIAESALYGQRGATGFYVSSTVDNTTLLPYLIYFNDQLFNESDLRDGQAQGYSVRCVRQ